MIPLVCIGPDSQNFLRMGSAKISILKELIGFRSFLLPANVERPALTHKILDQNSLRKGIWAVDISAERKAPAKAGASAKQVDCLEAEDSRELNAARSTAANKRVADTHVTRGTNDRGRNSGRTERTGLPSICELESVDRGIGKE